jgi:O-antigen ligase
MSERAYLSTLDLSWAIDAHNSVLQCLYGGGIVGLVLLFRVWFIANRFFESIKIDNLDDRTIGIFKSANIAFILFGLTSSQYFSRPSESAIFISSLVILIYTHKKVMLK